MIDEKTRERAARYIIYEIQMFYFTYRKLHENIDPLIKNAMLESCLIHAYNLFRFFYQGEVERKNGQTRKRKPTDMIAEDYIERKAYFRQNRIPKRYFKNLEKKRNKQLAHLTYNRTTMRGWHKKMFERLWETVDVFLATLSPEINKKWFEEPIKQARQRRTTAH